MLDPLLISSSLRLGTGPGESTKPFTSFLLRFFLFTFLLYPPPGDRGFRKCDLCNMIPLRRSDILNFPFNGNIAVLQAVTTDLSSKECPSPGRFVPVMLPSLGRLSPLILSLCSQSLRLFQISCNIYTSIHQDS